MKKYEFDNLLKPLIDIYDEIEIEIIKDILDRLLTYDKNQGSLKWYLEKLKELKVLQQKDLKIINKNKKQIEKILKDILHSAGTKIDNLDNLKKYYEQGLIDKNPLELFENPSANKLINEALKDTYTIMDLINTKAIEGANRAYKNIINKAYIETSSGIYTYTESIRNALDSFAKEGIKTVNYESGVSLSIESAIRRDIVTRVNKLVGDCEIENAKLLGTNLMYVDQHLGARVRTKYTKEDYEVHAEWQGKKYMIEGSNNKYDNLYEKTGYGKMLGLKGINCYHHMHPTWEWEKIPDRIDEVENKERYELLQRQRAYERNIRSLKRQKLVAKEMSNKEDISTINKKIKSTNLKFDNWLEKHSLTRDYNREYVSNIKTKENDIQYSDVTKKWLDNATPNSHKVQDRGYFDKDNIKYQVDGKNVVLDYSNEEKEIAQWLENTFGGEIYMMPRINKPDGIQTADYLFRGEYWDLKEIKSSGKKVIDNRVNGLKRQTRNFIFDISNNLLNNEEIINQIERMYKSPKRDWVDKVILIRDKNLIKIFERNKKD